MVAPISSPSVGGLLYGTGLIVTDCLWRLGPVLPALRKVARLEEIEAG